ncbi:MAG: hypothetical protein RSD67_07515 [Oscillospiraceae bacterium]
MKKTNIALGLACTLAMIFCLGGCASLSQDAQQSSSEAISSSSESEEQSSSNSNSSASEIQSESASVPSSSTTANEAKPSSAPVSSSAESQEKPSGASTKAEDEIVYIEPNRDLLPNTPPETDNQKPTIVAKEPRSQQYESGKVLLTCVKIDGTTYEVEVADGVTKKQIAKYVDGMKSSSYTVQNTPPGGGEIIDVEIHRNDVIELYAFSSQTQDGNPLGRNFSGPNPSSWTIADKDAFDYLSKLLSIK